MYSAPGGMTIVHILSRAGPCDWQERQGHLPSRCVQPHRGIWYGTTLIRGISADFLVALAVDMTARNLQDEVKKKGLPWSAVKGFDTFTPIRYVLCRRCCPVFVKFKSVHYSAFVPKSAVQDAQNLNLSLKVFAYCTLSLASDSCALLDQWEC